MGHPQNQLQQLQLQIQKLKQESRLEAGTTWSGVEARMAG
jgi:hypothetical protein